MKFDFTGKSVLVTGGGGGVGRATAVGFARHGGRVVFCDTDRAGGETTQRQIAEAGGTGVFVEADIGDRAAVIRLVGEAVARHGGLDIAVNNAAIDPEIDPKGEWDEAVLDRVLRVNLGGVFIAMKFEIEQMLKQGGGAIVNLGSVASVVGVSGKPAYVASKHGVLGLTRTAALQFADRGIRVNLVCPGSINTPMFDRNLIDPAIAGKAHPLGRIAEPEEIAEAVMFLASDQAAFITAHPLMVDGGYVAG